MADVVITPKPSPAPRAAQSAPLQAPDTRSFLAIAIVLMMAGISLILLLHPLDMNDKVFGAFATILGVLTGCFKDVYSFSFGTSKGKADADATIADNTVALANSTPVISVKAP